MSSPLTDSITVDTNSVRKTNGGYLDIAVLISGGGTTLKNLIDRSIAGLVPIRIKLVISSSASAGGLRYAAEAQIPSVVIRKSDFPDPHDYREAMFGPIRDSQVDWVVMGGFLKHLLIPDDFRHRVINIHPSLIPAFCGHGMYGLKVHQAAVDFGVRVSGCTVHFVDDQFDHGPILLQRSCPVYPDDTAESLQKRVFQLECEALPDALKIIHAGCVAFDANGRLQVSLAEEDVARV